MVEEEALATSMPEASAIGGLPPKLPIEAWCRSLSYVVRGNCLPRLCPTNRFFKRLISELLSWEGAAVTLVTRELEEQDGRPRFDPLIPRWSLCSNIFADFSEAHCGAKRKASRRCFSLLSHHCSEARGLFVNNWCLMERDGLACICSGFPSLRHVELNSCDFLSHTNCARIFSAHPELLSFRATFAPKGVMSHDLVNVAPRGLMAFGYANVEPEDASVLEALLQRCPLQHLWLARTTKFSPAVATLLASATQPLISLSLPETVDEQAALAVARSCPALEMLCCWGDRNAPALNKVSDFELRPSRWASLITLRRSGSCAEPAANGALWAPYAQSSVELLSPDI